MDHEGLVLNQNGESVSFPSHCQYKSSPKKKHKKKKKKKKSIKSNNSNKNDLIRDGEGECDDDHDGVTTLTNTKSSVPHPNSDSRTDDKTDTNPSKRKKSKKRKLSEIEIKSCPNVERTAVENDNIDDNSEQHIIDNKETTKKKKNKSHKKKTKQQKKNDCNRETTMLSHDAVSHDDDDDHNQDYGTLERASSSPVLEGCLISVTASRASSSSQENNNKQKQKISTAKIIQEDIGTQQVMVLIDRSTSAVFSSTERMDNGNRIQIGELNDRGEVTLWENSMSTNIKSQTGGRSSGVCVHRLFVFLNEINSSDIVMMIHMAATNID
jgi:hypothetical protein